MVTNLSGSLQADVAGAVLRKGLNIPTGPTRPSTAQYATIWGLVATVIALALGFIVSTKRFSTYTKSVERVNIFRATVPAVALFALANVLMIVPPQANHVTLKSMKVFYPDIWLCLSLSALICGVWATTRVFIYFKSTKLA